MTELQSRLIKLLQCQPDGFTPSYEEIRIALGLSGRSQVHSLVASMCRRGLISREPHRARSLRVVEQPDEVLRQRQRLVSAGSRAVYTLNLRCQAEGRVPTLEEIASALDGLAL